MIIKTLLILTLFFCCTNLFLVFKNYTEDYFSRLLKFSLVFIFFHALHVLLSEYFFPLFRYVDSAAPYGLVYGPLFYFLILGIKNRYLKRYALALHLIPFIGFFIVYFFLLFNVNFRTSYLRIFLKILYSAIPLSFLGYIIASIFKKSKIINNQKSFINTKEFVNTMGMFLLFIAIFFNVVRFTGGNVNNNPARIIVYSTMLAVVLYIFKYLVRRMTEIRVFPIETTSKTPQSKNEDKYTKVKITAEQLDEYEEKLYTFMNESKVFLDTELSLIKLSKELKIPKYHLTQLFSLRIGKNFNQFVNSYRVNFACTILSENKDIKIEDLIYQCGFNSKSSFNRHFKIVVGITPSEYYSQLKE